jgi:hypothetical protein
MNRITAWQKINLVSATVCIVMSVQAFLVVVLGITTGWDWGLTDEGSAAHIFQLLIACQLPFALAFLASADWGRLRTIMRPAALEFAALALAFGTLAFFRL